MVAYECSDCGYAAQAKVVAVATAAAASATEEGSTTLEIVPCPRCGRRNRAAVERFQRTTMLMSFGLLGLAGVAATITALIAASIGTNKGPLFALAAAALVGFATFRIVTGRHRLFETAASRATFTETRRKKKKGAPEEKRELEEPAPYAPSTAIDASATNLDEEEAQRKARSVALVGGGLCFAAALTYAGLEYGPPAVVLLLTGGALIGVISAFWGSVRTLLGETRLTGADAYALGAPRAEEEQKRAVLRALKDLEFERAVGKISQEDYAVLVARYREDGRRLLRILDEASAEQRERAAAVVEQKLRASGVAPPAATGPAFEPIVAAAAEPPPGEATSKPAEEESGEQPSAEEEPSGDDGAEEKEPSSKHA